MPTNVVIPMRATLCALLPLMLVACGGGHDSPPRSVGGNVSGLSGTGLVLQNNSGNDLSIGTSGTFTFSASVAEGSPYAVTIKTQPSSPSQTCAVGNGSGTAPGSCFRTTTARI